MTPSKITVPLFWGIAGTVGFNLSPIVFGYGMTMNICFMLYAGIMFVLSFADRRVLGYATVLSACNPANQLANVSFPFLLATLTIVREFRAVGQVIRELGKQRWWWLLLAAFLLAILSVPLWHSDLRAMITEVKQVSSRLGFLAVFPLAVGLTFRTIRDGVRAVSLLCLISVAFFGVFYWLGRAGVDVIEAVPGGESIGVFQSIGNIALNFVRTQVSIPLAALAAASLGLAVGVRLNRRAIPFYVASGASLYLIMLLASVGSAFAMLCGMGIVALGYLWGRRSARGILLGVILFVVVGATLYWAVFGTENVLSLRMGVKYAQVATTGIDRQVFWEEGIAEIRKTPFGEGWSTRTGHSDWLLFVLSYGWLTGLLYIAAVGSLWLSMWCALLRPGDTVDRQSTTLLLAGLAALSVYCVNAVLDMPSANIGYYQTVWALILAPAAVMAVSNVVKRTRKSNDWRSA